MPGGVFISYRREDSRGSAGRIYDRVARRLGRDSVFFDVDNIPPGMDFVEVLSERVSGCHALVAVIGTGWVTSAGKDNRRRIDDPHDFVRVEIEAALEHGIRIIPVLVDGAAMPKSEDLPDSIKKLARRQGIEVSDIRFDADVKQLTRTLAQLVDEIRQREVAEAERVARKKREKPEVAEAADTRRSADAEAAGRAEEECRSKEPADAARAAHEERERREAGEPARIDEAQRQVQTIPEPSSRDARRLVSASASKGWLVAAVVSVVFAGAAVTLFTELNDRRGSFLSISMPAAPIAESNSSAPALSNAVVRAPAASLQPDESSNVAAQTPAIVLSADTPAEQYDLGERYYYGRGVQQDFVKATEWYRKAADQGDRAAQIMLGSLYENGLGVIKDHIQALSWYQKAADHGSPLAEDALKRLRASDSSATLIPPATPSGLTTPQEQYEKGDAYYWGRAGVNQDYQQAFYWYRKAADQNDPAAEIMLGSLYENGLGVSKDYGQARWWYQKAADQGRPLAQEALKRLAGK